MRQKEQRLWDAMRRRAPKWLWLQRIENAVGEGIPDVYVASHTGRSAWVELKAPIKPVKATTRLLGTEGLRQSQINWHIKAARMNLESYILIRDNDGQLYLLPSAIAAQINELSALELSRRSLVDTWDELWEVFL